MKSKYILLSLIGLLALFIAVSCGSTPPAEEEVVAATPAPAPTPAPTPPPDPDTLPPDQATLDAMNSAAARAEAARQLVTDFDGPDAFPSDWQTADSLFSQAEQQKNTNTALDTRNSTDRYNQAADALEALRDKTLAQAHDSMQAQLIEARDAAVNAGAAALIPDVLLEADNTAAVAQVKYDAKDYYGAKDSADDALGMYSALTSGLAAYTVRERIAERAGELIPEFLDQADDVGLDAIDKWYAGDYSGAKDRADTAFSMYVAFESGLAAYTVRENIVSRNFELYDAYNFNLADTSLIGAAGDYDAGQFASAKDKADNAFLHYNLALNSAWVAYAADQGAAAASERQYALNLRANVAVRDEFNAAQAVYNRANTAFQAQRFEESANLFIDSFNQFEVVVWVATQKRLDAEDALVRANQAMAESDETARTVERILEGGTQ